MVLFVSAMITPVLHTHWFHRAQCGRGSYHAAETLGYMSCLYSFAVSRADSPLPPIAAAMSQEETEQEMEEDEGTL